MLSVKEFVFHSPTNRLFLKIKEVGRIAMLQLPVEYPVSNEVEACDNGTGRSP